MFGLNERFVGNGGISSHPAAASFAAKKALKKHQMCLFSLTFTFTHIGKDEKIPTWPLDSRLVYFFSQG